MYETLSDEQVMRMLHTQADACVRVVQMPDEQRYALRPKGQASPHEAGTLNAVLALLAERECRRRGLLQGSTLEDVA